MGYEIRIKILDKDYVDSLILALVHQGYEVYFSYDNEEICYIPADDEVMETGEKR